MNLSAILYIVPKPLIDLCALPIALARPGLLLASPPLASAETMKEVVAKVFGDLSLLKATILTTTAAIRIMAAIGIAFTINKAAQKDRETAPKTPNGRERLWTLTSALISLPSTLLALGIKSILTGHSIFKKSLEEGDAGKYKTAAVLTVAGCLAIAKHDFLPTFGAVDYLVDSAISYLTR